MKKLFLFFLSSSIVQFGKAQNALTIPAGNEFFISPATTLHIDGLSLTPSSGFSVNGLSVAKNSTVTNSGLANSIAKAYQFSAATGPFSGTIRLYYSDAELNSLSESSLTVQIHNGTTWQTGTGTTRDAAANYVEAATISNNALNELTLSTTTTLPLTWGFVSGAHKNEGALIQWSTMQEEGVAYFVVERKDNNGWQPISGKIAASNSATEHPYEYFDHTFAATALYRIHQADEDGRSSYSPIIAVSAPAQNLNTRLYPNPVQQQFKINFAAPAAVRSIQLYHASGLLVKSWDALQTTYSLTGLSSGVYYICITEKNGGKQFVSLVKNQ